MLFLSELLRPKLLPPPDTLQYADLPVLSKLQKAWDFAGEPIAEWFMRLKLLEQHPGIYTQK